MDYQAKYESLLRNVLSDLNTEVLAAQSRAEKNAEGENNFLFLAHLYKRQCVYAFAHCPSMIKPLTASSAYCTGLQERFRESESELEAVKNELEAVKSELEAVKNELEAVNNELQEKGRNEIAVLREELTCAQSQLAEDQEKLKVYAEREKLAKTESELVSRNYSNIVRP